MTWTPRLLHHEFTRHGTTGPHRCATCGTEANTPREKQAHAAIKAAERRTRA